MHPHGHRTRDSATVIAYYLPPRGALTGLWRLKASTTSVVGLLDGYGAQLFLIATTKPKNHNFWLTGATRGWLYEPVVLIQGRTLLLLPRLQL